MRSESKTLKHSLKHWGIWLFILIVLNFGVIFWVVADGLGGLFDRSKIEETQEGSGDETDTSTESSSATEGETEATEFTEWIPVIRYPEGSIMIDSDEQKMMYFRNWYLSYLNVPGRLGDSCYISVKVPQLEGKYGKRSASVYLYYQKEDKYYYSTEELIWDEGVSLDLEHRTVYLHDVKHSPTPYDFKQIDLIPENNDGQTTDYLQISGNLSQEIYPAGQEVFKSRLWATVLEAVGFWHGKQTGELFGNIKGEVYVMNAETGECWICLEGIEPIKVLHTNTSWYRMKEAYTPIEGVSFTDEEKSRALARLSFDLKVEALKEK